MTPTGICIHKKGSQYTLSTHKDRGGEDALDHNGERQGT